MPACRGSTLTTRKCTCETESVACGTLKSRFRQPLLFVAQIQLSRVLFIPAAPKPEVFIRLLKSIHEPRF